MVQRKNGDCEESVNGNKWLGYEWLIQLVHGIETNPKKKKIYVYTVY